MRRPFLPFSKRKGSFVLSVFSRDWLSRNGNAQNPQPVWRGFNRNGDNGVEDYSEAAGLLRQAFTFFRTHSDRRYSAASLMKLHDYADSLDRVVQEGGRRAFRPEDAPSIVMVETPFTYDEDTEVKSGGVLGCGVLLPDNRLMVCVHGERRRGMIGHSIISFARHHFGTYPCLWIHRANTSGQQFALAVGMSPWTINPSGAVQYSAVGPAEDDTGAAEDGGDPGFLLALEQERRPARRNPRRVRREPVFGEADPELEGLLSEEEMREQ